MSQYINKRPSPRFMFIYFFEFPSLLFSLSLSLSLSQTHSKSKRRTRSLVILCTNLSNFFYNQHFLSLFFFFFQSLPYRSPLIFSILGLLSHTSNIKNSWFCYEFIIIHNLDLLIFILIVEYMLILDFSSCNVGNVLPLQFFTDPVKRGFDSNYMILSSKNRNWVLSNLSFNE